MTHARAVCCIVITAVTLSACSGDPVADAQRYTASGDSYAARQQDAEAIIEYGRALQLTPNNADTRFKLAQAYERQGDSAKAFDEYVTTAELQPSNLAAHMKIGSALLAAGDFAGARHRAEVVLKTNATYAPGYVLLGNALAGLQDVKSALHQIERALTIDPASAPAWMALGAARQAMGSRREAAAAFEKAIAAAPSSAHPHVAAASFHWVNGDVTRAEDTLKRALTAEPSSRDARRTLAWLYLETDRAPMAEPHLRALAVDPPGTFALADYLTNHSRFQEALVVLRDLETHADKAVARTARLRRAAVLHAAARGDEAHQLLDAMIAQGDDSATAHVAKARLLLNEGRSADALQHAKTALTLQSSAPAARYVLGLAAMETGDLDAAADAFSDVARADPRSAAATLQLARIRLAQGDFEGAVNAADEGVTREPRNADASALLVRGLREQGQIERARRELERAQTQSLQSARLTVERGWLALVSGDSRTARTSFSDVLSTPSVAADAQSGLIAVDLAEGRVDVARARVADWRREAGSDSRLALLAARVEIAAGTFDKAASHVREVLARDPATAEAHDLLARIFVAQGRHDEALAQFDQLARTSESAAARAHTMIGLLHEQRKDLGAARAAYERALAANARAAVAANNLAWIHTQTGGDLKEALRLAQVANEEMRRPESEDTLGWVYHQLGLTAQALTAFESARRRAPGNATYHYHAGLAYAKAGDRTRAGAALQKALGLDPGLAAARTAYLNLRPVEGKSQTSK
jgi:tetratricopeptide (TPR) repeat protein